MDHFATALLLAAAPFGRDSVPFAMLVLFVSAKLLAELAERVGQPAIVGEILAGVLIGPSVLGWLAPNDFLSAMGDLGAMFLLFRVGLEVKSSELMRVSGTATVVACSGVALPFVMGAGLTLLFGSRPNEAIFAGATLVATSVGITAQVLAAKGLLDEIASKVILAAAVIDDVLGLLVLAAVGSLTHGRFNLLQLSLTALLAAGFTVMVARWGTHAMRHTMPRLERSLRATEARFVLALGLLFALAVLAASIGIAAIVGAFLAGLAFAETAGQRERDLAQGVAELLVPFFLAGIGLRVDLSAFTHAGTAWFAVVLIAAAVVSKFVGCGLAALPLGRRNAWRVGVGMVPRGEVGMIVAQIGLATGMLARGTYSVVILMSVATTLIAPPLIHLAYREQTQLGGAAVGEEMLRLG